MPTGKVCTKCDEAKPLEDFYKKSSGRQGRASRCKPCIIAQVQGYQKTVPKKLRDQYRETSRIKKYGLTPERHAELLESQEGLCSICKEPETAVDPRNNKLRSLCIDHCHVTGKPRGLLCKQCNLAIGHFRDSIATLESAIAYLKEWQ